MQLPESRQAGAEQFVMTKDAFARVYEAWREGLVSQDFPDLPMAPATSDSLFQLLLSALPREPL